MPYVYVPIVRGPTQREVWTFAKALALLLAARHPELATAEYTVARRPAGEITYTISDEGPGFDPGERADPTEPANLERVHGRGLMLMRMFMDEVSHAPGGNVVVLRKRRKG